VEPEKDELIDLLREAGLDAHEFLPGETLPQFIERTHHEST
jgi:hypothetical protein